MYRVVVDELAVDVVLPVLNEAEALPWVLSRLPAGYRAVVVDNGSTDGSGELARQLGALVVHEPVAGFGAACAAGLEAVQSEVVCFMDGDGSLDPVELPSVAAAVAAGEVDLRLGARRAEPGAWPISARMANRMIALELRRRLGLPLTDLGPMRAARTRALRALAIEDRRFGWPLEMVVRAAREGWRIDEVPVGYRPRLGGRSKVSGNLRGALRAVRDMAAVRP